MSSITLAIVGSRTFHNYAHLERVIDQVRKNIKVRCIVSGGAKGADTLAKRYAVANKIEYVEKKPDWEKYGKGAGFERNADIVDCADHVIAFWDSESHGTAHSIGLARESKKLLMVVEYKRKL